MSLPLSPLSTRAASAPSRPRLTASRWERWSPWVLVHLNSIGDTSSASYARYRDRHADRILWLTTLGIPALAISRNQLDDPRLPDADAQARVTKWLSTRDKFTPKRNRRKKETT